jgi:hypothetical protein
MGPFRPASVPGGGVAIPRTGTDARPYGPTDAAAGGPYISWPPLTSKTAPVMNEL